jgi:hypothetical protein
MRLEIDEGEWALLVGLLDELLGDLRDEIYRAESHDFKEQLRAKKAIAKGLLARLRPEAPIPAGAG